MTQIKSCWKTEATLQARKGRKINHTHDKAGPFMTGRRAVIFEILLKNDLQELEFQFKSKRLLHSSVLKLCCNYVLKLCRLEKLWLQGLFASINMEQIETYFLMLASQFDWLTLYSLLFHISLRTPTLSFRRSKWAAASTHKQVWHGITFVVVVPVTFLGMCT